MIQKSKTCVMFLLSAVVLMTAACSSGEDYSGDINKEKERLDSIEKSMNTIVRQLQSLVYVPETSTSIRVDGTNALTLRYRVEPKKLASALAEHWQQLSFESKTLASKPSLTITQATGDNNTGVLSLAVSPSEGFESGGDYAFALLYTENGSSFVSAYTPVFVVTHPIALTLSCLGIGDTSDPVTVGTTIRVVVNYEPANTTETGVTWSSSDTSVATVDENGMVTLVDNGTVTITATSTDRPDVSGSVKLIITGGNIIIDPKNETGQDEAE